MSKNKYKVVVSDAALMMLDSHVLFLARVSKEAATKLKNKIIADLRSLEENPLRFPVYENQFVSGTEYRKMFSARRYLVIYEITDKTVYVEYIVDCRQDYEWIIS